MSILSYILPKTGLHFYNSKQYYYEQKITISADIQEVLSLYNNVDSVIKVQNNIQAFDIPMGSSLGFVRRQMGSPILEYKCESIKERKILIYKSRFVKTKVLTQFHFFNNKLFIVENHFHKLNDAEHNILQKIFSKKYNLPLNHVFDSYKLIDTKGNRLLVSKDIYTSMVYLHNNAEILQALEEKHINKSLKNLNQYQLHLSDWFRRL